MKFRKYINLIESVKEVEFDININSKIYTVVRNKHLIDKRSGDPKPKDFKMSKSKYEKVLVYIDKINIAEPFSFTWKDNNKSNIISAYLKGSKIFVFGAIMNSTKDEDKLYPDVTNRYSIKEKI